MLPRPSGLLARAVTLAAAAAILAACSGATPAVQGPTTAGLTPKGETAPGLGVIRVVDGDTIHVNRAGQDVTVRMIGIDTPETVKPDSPVGCFGPEASDFAKESLTGRTVTLEFDDSQGRTDRYGRTLAYVWVEGNGGSLSLFNLDAVARGYARERQYGPTPFAWKREFRVAEDAASSHDVGLWAACSGES
ncbi:MAG: thermonuclease family protein [bacterium]|nr:thermonuclease family protein [bacterium]